MGISSAAHPRSTGVKAMYGTAHRPWPSSTRFNTGFEDKHIFDVQTYFKSASVARVVVECRIGKIIFAQGDPATSVFYIQEGSVKLTVVNEAGKEAVVSILGPGDFLGEGCLAHQSVYMATATAITPTTITVIEKHEMIRMLHEQHTFADQFITYMLTRNIRAEEDLVDQLFNSSERRLARALLLMVRHDEQDRAKNVLPAVSQEMLAEMVGTTRSRINVFMNKFKKRGYIQYSRSLRGLHVNRSLLSFVMHG